MNPNHHPHNAEGQRRSPASSTRSISPNTRAFLQQLIASIGPNDARGVALRGHQPCIEMNAQLRRLIEKLLGVINQGAAALKVDSESSNTLDNHGLRPRVFNAHQNTACMPREQEFVQTEPQSGDMPAYLSDESTTSRLPLPNLLPTLDFNAHGLIGPSTGSLDPSNLSRAVPSNDSSLNSRVGSGPSRNNGSSTLEQLIRTGNLSEDQVQHILSMCQPK